MNLAVWVVCVVLAGHWVADFVLQPHWMSLRKSKDWGVLAQHATVIFVGGLATAIVIMSFHSGDANHPWALGYWAAINAAGHFVIDAVTSRVTSRLYAKGRTHDFFVVIGFDQLLHTTMAIATLAWLVL